MEFSNYILILSQISAGFFSALVFVVIIGMSLTGYFIKFESGIYGIFLYPAKILNKIPVKKEEFMYGLDNKKEIIIFGCQIMGSVIIKELMDKKDNILVIDFNPEIIKSLIEKKIPCLYRDYSNPEIINKIPSINLKIIISTIPDNEQNENLIKKAKEINVKIKVIVIAEKIHDALELYKSGADYVILPRLISGENIGSIIQKVNQTKEELKKKHIKFLKENHQFLYKPK